MKLQKDDVILFNGDSITDCGRNRDDFHSLSAYSKMLQDSFTYFYPSLNITSFNRGISGNTSSDLLLRIEDELKETKATVLSILIGINDTWRGFDSNRPTSAEQYAKNCEEILKIAKKYVREIIILEPFLVPVDAEKAKFRQDLNPKIDVLRTLARKYKTDYIPLDGILAEKCITVEPVKLSHDGIHPCEDGYAVIASEWLKRVKV